MRKLYGISKAENLPINIEDAARSESEIEKALQVYLQLFYFFFFSETIFRLCFYRVSISDEHRSLYIH